jgi:maltoporin
MIIHSINDLTNTSVMHLLEENLSQIIDVNLAVNYNPKYKNNNANLFYLLDNGRFSMGNYYVMQLESGEYVGSAGWNKYTDDTALAFVRAYVPPNYRVNYYMAKYLMPKILEEAVEYKKLWITCNEHNKAIYNGLTKTGLASAWPSEYKLFKPIGKHIVNYVEQYVAEYST